MTRNSYVNFSIYSCVYHTIVLLSCCCEHCQCANHYCVNGHTMSIRMGGLYHKDETIIPEIPDEPIYKRGSYRSCSWEITADEVGNQNAQIVLEGVNLENQDASGSSNKTQVNILLNQRENVTLGMFQVKPLSQRNHISVQINWNPKTQSRSPVNLRILIPVADLCSRDMLSFNDSCHAISTVPAGIMKAVEHCSGDASLTSFTSMAQINDFFAANEARQEKLPYSSPLDLSKWVRLGMFYRAEDDAILSVVRTEIGCELVRVNESLFEKPQKNGSCGSLRVDESGKTVLKFSDCDEKMPALMSFPEIANSTSPRNCSINLMREIEKLRHQTSTQASASTSVTRVNNKARKTRLRTQAVTSRRFNDPMLFTVQAESAKFGSNSTTEAPSHTGSIPLVAFIFAFALASTSLIACLLLLVSVRKTVSLHQKICQCSQNWPGHSSLKRVSSNGSLHAAALASTQDAAESLVGKPIAVNLKTEENHVARSALPDFSDC